MGTDVPASTLGSGGFGADTTIQQANSAAALVNTLELINALTVTTAGAETATYTLKVPLAGVQTNAQVISGTGTLFPAGTAAIPGVSIGDAATGFFKGTVGGDFIGFGIGGSTAAFLRSSQLVVVGETIRFGADTSSAIQGTISADATVKNLTAFGFFGSSQSDFVIGQTGALATNATGGFLQIPTCPGTPTGTAHLNTGKAAMLLDTTGSKVWFSSVAGTWKGVVIS